MSHSITNSSLVDVLTNLNLKETQNNSTLHCLLQKLVTTSDQNPSLTVLKQDPTSDDLDSSQDPPKKRKLELERGEEELQNICKVQRMQRNRESAARSRMRKREYIEELEAKLNSLANEANQSALLKERIARLEAENQNLRLHLEKFQFNQSQQILPYPPTYQQQQPEFQLLNQSSPLQQIPTPVLVINSPPHETEGHELEQQVVPTISSIPNTPPKSPEEMPSPSFSKYATLKEFSLQMEREKAFPLLIFWLMLLCGLTKNLTQKSNPTWISCGSWTTCQTLTVPPAQSFEASPKALSFWWINLNFFSLPP